MGYLPPIFDDTTLRKVLVENQKSQFFSKPQAISVLPYSNLTNKEEILESILTKDNESSFIRYSAALNLARIGSSKARKILLENIEVEDDLVLEGIIKAVARIGDKDSLKSLRGIQERSTNKKIRELDRFAIGLISYRYDLEGNRLPFPREGNFWDEFGKEEQQLLYSFDVFRPTNEEIESCIRSLGSDTVGINVTKDPAYMVSFPSHDRESMVLFNDDLVKNKKLIVKFLLERKVIAGIIASKSMETQQYGVDALILSSPTGSENKIEILISSFDGKIGFAGRGIAKNDEIKFNISSLKTVPFLLYLRGTITNKTIEVETRQYSPK